MKSLLYSLPALSLLLGAGAYSIPANVQRFYDEAKGGRCTGKDKIAGGFQDTDDGPTCRFPSLP